MEIILIRHGKTKGNLESRYIGTTDESLCEVGRNHLENYKYPAVDLVFVSPLKRCIETREILYPNIKPRMIYNLRECNFGDFENKNYKDLSENEDYQKWIDSMGTLPFPNGESRDEFQNRCLESFCQGVIIGIKEGMKRIAFIIHGGTIMSILEAYAYPKEDYYHWQVDNGEGYIVKIEENEWIDGLRTLFVTKKCEFLYPQ